MMLSQFALPHPLIDRSQTGMSVKFSESSASAPLELGLGLLEILRGQFRILAILSLSGEVDQR